MEGLVNIEVSMRGEVAVAVMNRPQALNALNRQTFTDLEALCDRLAADRSVRALVITGAGDKAFVAGADITEFSSLSTPEDGYALATRGQDILFKLEALPMPVIAAVNGFALGGGLELALSCDLRVASERARFALPEIALGIIPGYGGTQRLARLVGMGRAKRMVYSGEMIDSAEALRIGLVEEVVAPDALLDRALALAVSLGAKAPLAFAQAKRSIQEGVQTDLVSGCRLEARLFSALCLTEDMREGASAFLEKRRAVFRGR